MSRYAMVAVWKMNPEQAQQQMAGLNERIIPLVRSQPGFVQGRWTRAADGVRHVVYVEFDTESDARRFSDFVAQPDPRRGEAGVANEAIDVLEIVGSA